MDESGNQPPTDRHDTPPAWPRPWAYVLLVVLTYTAVGAAWSLRGAETWWSRGGADFTIYSPGLGFFLALHVGLLAAALLGGGFMLRANALLPTAWALAAAIWFYHLHDIPLSRDMASDFQFARLGAISSGVAMLACKDLLLTVWTVLRTARGQSTSGTPDRRP